MKNQSGKMQVYNKREFGGWSMIFPGERIRWGLVHILLIPPFVLGLQFVYFSLPGLFSSLLDLTGLPPTRTSEFLLNYLLYFACFVAAIMLVLIITRSGLGKLGFKVQDLRRTLTWGVGGGMLLFILILGAGYIVQLLQPELLPQPFEDVLRDATSYQELLMMLLVGSVLAPLVEEMYFRGMVYPVLRKYIGVTWAIVASGLFFGLLHWDLWRTIPLALGGMGLAYIYERSCTIYAPWLAHGIWNGIMAILVFFGQRMA
jgi:membrane protease YdiL (CAAX protease family)